MEELCPLRPPVQPLKPRWAFMTANYNSPPTLHLSLQHSIGLSLQDAACLPWASADSGAYRGSSHDAYCPCTYCEPGTVPDTLPPSGLTAVLGEGLLLQ